MMSCIESRTTYGYAHDYYSSWECHTWLHHKHSLALGVSTSLAHFGHRFR